MTMESSPPPIPPPSWDVPAPPFRPGVEEDYSGRSYEEALKISKKIDEQIAISKKAMERKKQSVQILLLGQSESGKSSVLKNFQVAFAPNQFEKDRIVWRTIIQLNLIMSLKLILDVLSREWEATDPEGKNPLTRELRRIRLGLSPLWVIEQNIMKLIAPEAKDHRDVCVRPGSNWKDIVRENLHLDLHSDDDEDGNRGSSHNGLNKTFDLTTVLVASKNDIATLWGDSNVRSALRRRSVRMEETPGFFLNDMDRVIDGSYIPTDSDIMRARIRTLGVEEHTFVAEKGFNVGSEVYITDVGGSRSQRPKWIPYFEDVQTILFLAPLTFDRALEEDPEVNRLEDSLMLWREICRNKILAKATLILFFNKTDVLRRTLAAGVKVKRFVPSYGDLPNEVAPVTKYFCDKFRTYHRKLSPVPRPFMFHETSAIDTSSMAALLLGIREAILRVYLQDSEMI